MSESIKTILQKWEQRPRRVIDYTNPDDTNWNNELLLAVRDAIPMLKKLIEPPMEEKPAEPIQPEATTEPPSEPAGKPEATSEGQDSVTLGLRQPETPPENAAPPAPEPPKAPTRRGGRRNATPKTEKA